MISWHIFCMFCIFGIFVLFLICICYFIYRCILRILCIFLIIWHILHILHILHNDICFKLLQFVYVNFQKRKKVINTKYIVHSAADQGQDLFSHIACAAGRDWTLAISKGRLLPCQHCYWSVRKTAFHDCFFPSWGHCCSRTTTCYSFCHPLFYHKKHLESVLLLFASCTVSSLNCLLEQEAASPVWRTLEKSEITYKTCADSQYS